MPDLPLNVLVLTLGSHGDVHPFVGLGMRLRDLGHRVTVLTNPHFEELVESHGLAFKPVGTEEDFHRFADDPAVWSRTRGGVAVLKALGQFIRASYDALAGELRENTVIVSSTLGLSARVLQDAKGVPAVTCHLAPFVFRSFESPPVVAGLPPLEWLPRFVQEHLWNGADRFVLDKALSEVNRLRSELDLEPVEGIMNQWWHAPGLTLGLWPKWFGPAVSDWPKQVELVGFPLYDERETAALSPELSAWLDEGEPPVAFTPGSAMKFGGRFFAAAAGACEWLGLRGLLLSRHAEHVPKNLPAGVRHEPFAPFSHLLPRCRAIVHHGGIGTSSQALAAGVPQVIMPMAHDQLDNARRLKRLGVAGAIHPRLFTARRVARTLGRLLDRLGLDKACATLAGNVEADHGLEHAADRIVDYAVQTLGANASGQESAASILRSNRSATASSSASR